MALAARTDKPATITYGRGSNDTEMLFLGDKPYNRLGNGGYADLDTLSKAEAFATAISAFVNGGVMSINSALYNAKDEAFDRTAQSDDGTSVSGTFVISHPTDKTKPTISIYVPKIMKALKVADVAAALKALAWNVKAGTVLCAAGTAKVAFKQSV